MELQTNTVLQGRYRIVRLMARGGMGAVYEAVDTRLGNTVALKQTLVHDPQLRGAFEREARLLASLQHPALPMVSDHFHEGGDQFLVMQFIAGDDLGKMLDDRQTAFPVADVLAWADRLLDALDYLHHRAPPIIHRDIKPQNLKLTPRGEVILLDFGLAKGSASSGNTAATAASLFGYTPQYAPLEQIKGEGTDPRSDLYALSATLYHLMTGNVPPDALTRVAALVRQQPDPLTPAHHANPSVSPKIATVLAAGLAPNPDVRPQSAADMRLLLREAAAQSGFNTGTAAFSNPPPTPINSSGVATVAIGANPPPVNSGGVSTVALGKNPPRQPDPTLLAQPAATIASSPAAAPAAPAISADRRFKLGMALLGLVLVIALGGIAISRLNTPTSPSTPISGGNNPSSSGGSSSSGGGQTQPAADEIGSRGKPYALGETVKVAGWEFTVIETVRGDAAWQIAYAENNRNREAPDGYEYILVKLRLKTLYGNAEQGQLYPGITGSSRVERTPVALVLPGDSPTETLNGGIEREGWIPYLIPVDERDLLLNIDPLTRPDGAADFDRYVALDPGATQIDDPALASIRATPLGRDFNEPANLGETTISEDWEITINSVIRGDEAFKLLLEANQFNDPAPQGFEYILLNVSARYIGLVPEYGPIVIDGLDFVGYPLGIAPSRDTKYRTQSVIEPDELQDYLYPGGAASGNVALLAPINKEVVVAYDPNNDLNHVNTRFFLVK